MNVQIPLNVTQIKLEVITILWMSKVIVNQQRDVIEDLEKAEKLKSKKMYSKLHSTMLIVLSQKCMKLTHFCIIMLFQLWVLLRHF